MKITKEKALQAVAKLRMAAKENGIQDMTPEDINNEIRCVRYGECFESFHSEEKIVRD